jgi:MFS family permease
MGVSGRVVGAVTAGWVMDRFGLDSPFVVAGIVIFSGAIIFGAFHSILVPDRTLESAAPTPRAADPDV